MSRKTYPWINTLACALAAAFLIFVFIYPHFKLKNFSYDIVTDTHALIDAVQAEEWTRADALIAKIEARVMKDVNMMRFFLDHEDIDQLQAVVKGAHRLVEQRDNAQLLFELEHMINIAEYIKGIESFRLYNVF